MVLDPRVPRNEVAELRKAAWTASLARVLKTMRRKPKDLETRRLRQDWKVVAAVKIHEESRAPISWPATVLKLGRPASVRSYLSRAKKLKINKQQSDSVDFSFWTRARTSVFHDTGVCQLYGRN